jgi:hypothetical protein
MKSRIEGAFMRDMKKRRYVLAFIIAAALFFLGFFFGFLMDLKRVDYFDQISSEQQLNLRSLQLQYELLQGDGIQDRCGAFRFLFDKFITELENNRARLDAYSKQSEVKTEDFDTLKRQYVLSQINFWHIAMNFKQACPNSSDFVTVLYFFSNNDICPDCEMQATVLNYYKSLLKENLLIFSFDDQFSQTEPLISMIEGIYDIKSYPALVVNDKTHSGLMAKENLSQILCEEYESEDIKKEICN